MKVIDDSSMPDIPRSITSPNNTDAFRPGTVDFAVKRAATTLQSVE